MPKLTKSFIKNTLPLNYGNLKEKYSQYIPIHYEKIFKSVIKLYNSHEINNKELAIIMNKFTTKAWLTRLNKLKAKEKISRQELLKTMNENLETVKATVTKHNEKQAVIHASTLDTINDFYKGFRGEFNRDARLKNKTALQGMIKESYIYDQQNQHTLKMLIIQKFLAELAQTTKTLAFGGFFTIEYQLLDEEHKPHYGYFTPNYSKMSTSGFITRYVNDGFVNFQNNIEISRTKSNLTFHRIIKVTVFTCKYRSALGKSYIDLPQNIKNKLACVNIQNTDDKCFLWSLIAYKNNHLMTGKKLCNVKEYVQYLDTIIEPEYQTYPVVEPDYEKFEQLNNIKINVFRLNDEDYIEHLYNTKEENANECNLLLIKNDITEHYVWIKNMSRLFANGNTHHKKIICSRCIEYSAETQELVDTHKRDHCNFNEECRAKYPNAGETTKFINYNNTFMHPFHIIADFESTLKKYIQEPNKANKQGVINVSNTIKYQKHIANSYGLKYNCIHDNHSEPVQKFNSADPEEVVKKFIEELERLAKKSYELLQLHKDSKQIIYKDNQEQVHYKTVECSNCDCFFTDDNKRVAHHDHITGEFISTLCSTCNLQKCYKKFLPVYLHNLKGYDSHLFIVALFKYGYQQDKSNNVTCIPNNEEKYISFSKSIKVNEYMKDGKLKSTFFEIRFIDTVGFMATSLDALTKNLAGIIEINGVEKETKTLQEKRLIFKNVSEQFPIDEQFEQMVKKGIYPYDFVDDYSKMSLDKLPTIEQFDNKLNKTKCYEKDYEQAQLVWKTFNCKTFLDYHNIYLITDVLLLADIWESFRDVCYKVYELDADYYYTAPSLSFDAMLKHTKIELELLSDSEMYLFVESGIRGGISQISKRHAIANNKYMKSYEEKKEESYIVYLDANNLYGGAMCEHMPVRDFKWNKDEWTKEKILALGDKDETGYLFSVDLHTPVEKHDYFNNYPLCPERIAIKKSNLSEWQQENYKESTVQKLCLTFDDKINYVVNYRYLKLCLSLGMELLKVNKVLQYTQTDFLKSYIEKNTNLRTQAKNEFEKDFYKLMNNSVFGKTMENVRNRINFRLISTAEEALNAKNMKKFTTFDEHLVGLHIKKTSVTLNKPIYLGQCILDDSKVTMYNFHYNFMLKKFNREDIDLLFTDTDSLCYHIRKTDPYKIALENKKLFDLSNFDEDSMMFDKTNKKVVNKFKFESTKQILEFVGLRSKLYCYTVEDEEKHHVKCKGVKKSVAEKEIRMNNFREILYNRGKMQVTQNIIRSHQHILYSESMNKVALSANDDKVYVNKDNINTLNFGHYKIAN